MKLQGEESAVVYFRFIQSYGACQYGIDGVFTDVLSLDLDLDRDFYIFNNHIRVKFIKTGISYFIIYANDVPVEYNGNVYAPGQMIYANTDRFEERTCELKLMGVTCTKEEIEFITHDYGGYSTNITYTYLGQSDTIIYNDSIRNVIIPIDQNIGIKFSTVGTAHWNIVSISNGTILIDNGKLFYGEVKIADRYVELTKKINFYLFS